MQFRMGYMRGRTIDVGFVSSYAPPMRRNEFLGLLLGGGMTAGASSCATGTAATTGTAAAAGAPVPPRSGARRVIRGICFDLFTLFDPRSVVQVAQTVVPERAAELCETWRTRQFQYSWLRASGGQYQDFRAVTWEALIYAARAQQLTLSEAQSETLVEAYSQLQPWPDTRAALEAFRRSGLRLATLANYSPRMISVLLQHGGLSELFDAQISTDAARTYKPDPRAYALGVSTLGLAREEIAFSAFGGWDSAGARWFGYPTFWVNRLGVAAEELGPGPDASGPTLTELAAFVSSWATG
ncbi:MAG: haloacetate dehalogenase [Pseudomonadota bacterium]